MDKQFQKNIFAKWLWIATVAIIALAGNIKAATYSAEELDTLVSTIALYPDPLLAHVLTASTHTNEIHSASLWSNAHKNLKGEALTAEMEHAELDYDASVLALIPFPTVLATMAQYSTWTSQLGEAVANQNGEVIFAIQRMRHAAYDLGNLKSDQNIKVNRDVYITIEPVKTQYIYVPVYNPSVVFHVRSDRFIPMHYSYGVWTGHWYSDWIWGDIWFEWHNHTIRHHPRPPRHNRHLNTPPPRHNNPAYAPAPAPRQDRTLAPRPSYSEPLKKQTVKQDASRPTYSKTEYVHSREDTRAAESPSNNPLNLTRNRKSMNTTTDNAYNNDDRKYEDRPNGDDRSSQSNNQSGGFRRSMRR